MTAFDNPRKSDVTANLSGDNGDKEIADSEIDS